MVAIWAGQETVPGDPAFPLALDVGTVDIMTQEGFGPTPSESQAIIDEAERQRAIIAAAEAEMQRRQELAQMEAAAQAAHEEYYGVGGAGYGTEPGGPDVVYYGDTVLYESEPGSLMPIGWEAPELKWPELPQLITDRALLAGGLVVAALFLK